MKLFWAEDVLWSETLGEVILGQVNTECCNRDCKTALGLAEIRFLLYFLYPFFLQHFIPWVCRYSERQPQAGEGELASLLQEHFPAGCKH